MKYVYSANRNAFYPMALQASYEDAGGWPVDGQEVEESTFAEFTGKPPTGKVLAPDKNGYPSWTAVPPLTHEQQVEIAENEKTSRITEANYCINSKQWPGKASLNRLKDDERIQYNLWLDYLDALEALDVSSAPDIQWPSKPE